MLSRVDEHFDKLTKRVDNLDDTTQKLAKSNQVIWNNQKELTKSEELLDEQFAVSTRMFIVTMNGLCAKLGFEERIDSEDVQSLFRDWATFKQRPDFRSLMMEWFLGVGLDKMPQLPAAPARTEGDVHVEGDHGDKVAVQEQPKDDGAGQTANVPQVQAEDGASPK